MADQDLSKSGSYTKHYRYEKTDPVTGKKRVNSGYRTVTHDKPGRPKSKKGQLRKIISDITDNEAALLLDYLKSLRSSSASNEHQEMPAQ